MGDFSMKAWISDSHSEALAGYQLPANTARLRLDGMVHLLADLLEGLPGRGMA
jgi:hypothetical protein